MEKSNEEQEEYCLSELRNIEVGQGNDNSGLCIRPCCVTVAVIREFRSNEQVKVMDDLMGN